MKTSFLNITDGENWRLEEADFNDADGKFQQRAYASFLFDDADGPACELRIMSLSPSGVIASLKSMMTAMTKGLEKMEEIEREILAEEDENNE